MGQVSRWTPLLLVQAAIAVVCIFGLFVIVVLLLFYEPPQANRDMLNLVLGAIVGVGFANIVGFFFGQKEQSEQQAITQATTEGASK